MQIFYIVLPTQYFKTFYPEVDLRGRGGRVPPLFFEIICFCFFCNHFEELHIMLFKVGLTINNAPLTYVYQNTIETCLAPNCLLFCRQLL